MGREKLALGRKTGTEGNNCAEHLFFKGNILVAMN